MSGPGIRIVYRSHGGDNRKRRPEFYSKSLALASFVRAAGAVDPRPEIVFLNDGPIPDDLLGLMRRYGEVVSVTCGSNRSSYRAAIALAAARGWPGQDVVWFAEDDYLYRVDALRQLAAAAAALPGADYFSLWGGAALDPATPRTRPWPRDRPRAEGDPDAVPVGGQRWYRAVSTTSTFGVRADVLAQDARLLRLLPFSGGAWDHTTSLVVQGLQPFTWRRAAEPIRTPMAALTMPPTARWLRVPVVGALQLVANLAARRPASRRRTLHAGDPESVFHLEYPTRATRPDWPQFAEQTRQWASQHGIIQA